MEESKPHTLKQLNIIHKALLAGQLLFAAIAFFLKYSGNFPTSLQELDQLLQVIAILLSFGGFFIGASLFKKKVQQTRESLLDIKAKANAYRSASIMQWALLEAPSLFCIICFLLVGNYAFLALSAALMIVFAITGPSRIKAMLHLQLNEAELESF